MLYDLTQQLHYVEVWGGEAEHLYLPADALLRAPLLGVHCLQNHEAALGVLGEVNLGHRVGISWN